MFVLSDFLTALARAPVDEARVAGGGRDTAGPEAAPADTQLERMLRLASKRHDVVAVTITDAAEERLPEAGVLALTDPETGKRVVVDTTDRATRTLYSALIARERDRLRHVLRQLRIEEVEVRTDTSYVRPLLAFFRRRERQLRR